MTRRAARRSGGRPGRQRRDTAGHHRPRRRFAQHFLEPAWVDKLASAIAPGPDQRFLEIGPGRGALTLALARQAARVLAVEIDRDLAADLARRAPDNVRVLEADVLRTDLVSLLRSEYGPEPRARIAGNLPYNISSPILFGLMRASTEPALIEDATLLIQSEVADRLVAAPGTKTYGVLTILVGLGAEVARLVDVPPGAFRPQPRVWSSLVRLRFRPPAVAIPDERYFELVVRRTFQHRRKMLLNAVAPLFGRDGAAPAGRTLDRIGIDGRRRPETLSLAELARLVEALRAGGAVL
jgi:16S rRNA (adenine1518-N6/adenine1519-N6)-dimethyltransferase